MSEERIITAATVTSGEKPDGKELSDLVRKSRETGMDVKTVIGDKAYSGKDKFIFNKDAGMYQCRAGHLAIHRYLDQRKGDKKNRNPRMVYFF